MADPGVVPNWASLAADFRKTTGRSLKLELETGPDGWLSFRVSIDQVFKGSYGTIYPENDVDRFVQLADDLATGFLGDEAGSSGWPACPDHGTHPLNATFDTSHQAVWKCPTGRIVARVGELQA